jgi:hypothetical protein
MMKSMCGAKGPAGIVCQCEEGHAGQHWGTVAKTWGKKTRKGCWSNTGSPRGAARPEVAKS